MNSEWLDEAHRRFGDREEVFSFVDSPFSLWSNLCDVFAQAYHYPYKEADIRAIYEFAEWCAKQPRGETAEDDLLTIVAVGFYEHVPEVPAAVKDLPRWFKLEEVLLMREILSYRVGDAGFEELLNAYPKSRRAKQKTNLASNRK